MAREGIRATLPEYGLIAICWAGVAVAAILLAGRTVIRIHRLRGLRADDYVIYVAFLALVANATLQTKQTPSAYYLAKAEAGLVPFDALLNEQGNTYVRYEFAIIGMLWTVLWLVKASFLAFFYNLFDGIVFYRRIWWGVAVFAFLAYVGCWLSSIFTCHPPADYFQPG